MRALIARSRVLLIAALLVLALCVFAPTAHCHGAIAFPPVQLADRPLNQEVASEYDAHDDHRTSKLRGTRVRDSVREDRDRRHQDVDPSALLAASSALMREIDSAIPDCGESRIDVEPVDVTRATQFVWQNDASSTGAAVLNDVRPHVRWCAGPLAWRTIQFAHVYARLWRSIARMCVCV